MLQMTALLKSCFLAALCSKSHMEELMVKPFQAKQLSAATESSGVNGWFFSRVQKRVGTYI